MLILGPYKRLLVNVGPRPRGRSTLGASMALAKYPRHRWPDSVRRQRGLIEAGSSMVVTVGDRPWAGPIYLIQVGFYVSTYSIQYIFNTVIQYINLGNYWIRFWSVRMCQDVCTYSMCQDVQWCKMLWNDDVMVRWWSSYVVMSGCIKMSRCTRMCQDVSTRYVKMCQDMTTCVGIWCQDVSGYDVKMCQDNMSRCVMMYVSSTCSSYVLYVSGCQDV